MTPGDREVLPCTDGDADAAGSRDFTVDASAASVSIALVDAADVTVGSGIVAFDDEADEDDFLDDTHAEITGVSTDDTLVPGTAAKFDGVAGGEIEFTVSADGQTVEFRVVEDDAALTYGAIASNAIVQSGEADTDEGVVTFEIDGSEAEAGGPDRDVYLRWQGSDAYAGAEQTLDGGSEIRIEWVDAEPAAADVRRHVV